jgi:hypothetical protein
MQRPSYSMIVVPWSRMNLLVRGATRTKRPSAAGKSSRPRQPKTWCRWRWPPEGHQPGKKNKRDSCRPFSGRGPSEEPKSPRESSDVGTRDLENGNRERPRIWQLLVAIPIDGSRSFELRDAQPSISRWLKGLARLASSSEVRLLVRGHPHSAFGETLESPMLIPPYAVAPAN